MSILRVLSSTTHYTLSSSPGYVLILPRELRHRNGDVCKGVGGLGYALESSQLEKR